MAVMKKEEDGEHPASDYLVVVDPEKVTTWHLQVKDHGKPDHLLMGGAKAALTSPGGHRGKPYGGPDKEEAIRKLKALYKSEGLDWSESASERGIPVLLMSAGGAAVDTPEGMAMQRPGAQLREIAVAVPGSWERQGGKLTITPQDLSDMVRNFDKRKNDMIVIDYEHASEMPEVARGGPVPGAGWIHGLSVNGKLTALVEWTPQAEEMLRSGQYRFFSPAIDWGAKDKATGEAQGATLTSGALTNHPFLEELPPIMLSDGAILTGASRRSDKGATTMADEKKKAKEREELEARKREEETERARQENHRAKDGAQLDDADGDGPGEHELPMLKIRQGRKGSKHEGHHILSHGDEDLGYMTEEDMAEHAKKHLGVNPDAAEDEKLTASERRLSLLSEVVTAKGALDADHAAQLAESGRMTFADYLDLQKVEKVIDAAVQAGKILPRDRKFFFRDALERPAEFADYVKNAQAVRLGSAGFSADQPLSVEKEIEARVRKLMAENGSKNYADSLKRVLASDPELRDRYSRRHTRPLIEESDGQNIVA